MIKPQITVAVILAVALAAGVTRLALGLGEPIGTAVNVAWVVFDLVILSVLVPAARYPGFSPKEAPDGHHS